MDYAHERQVIHRDVKPGNVLMGRARALVCDFGIALGAPSYLSPEQAMGTDIDRRAEVYGLGCVVYEMLTGEPPFTGATAQAVLARSLSGEMRAMRAVRPEVTPQSEAALRAAVASEPERRPATAGDLIERVAASLPVSRA